MKLLPILAVLVLSGCAMGERNDYANTNPVTVSADKCDSAWKEVKLAMLSLPGSTNKLKVSSSEVIMTQPKSLAPRFSHDGTAYRTINDNGTCTISVQIDSVWGRLSDIEYKMSTDLLNKIK